LPETAISQKKCINIMWIGQI